MRPLLFPHGFRIAGWILFIPSFIIGVLLYFNIVTLSGTFIETITNDAVIIGIVLGTLFTVCSRERIEDEMTVSIRLHSLLTSIYIYAGLLIICTLLFNGFAYWYFMTANLVLFPLVFLAVFKIKMHRYSHLIEDEKQD